MYDLNSNLLGRALPLDAHIHTDTGKLRTIVRLPSLGRTTHRDDLCLSSAVCEKTLAELFARVVSFVPHMNTVMTTSLMTVAVVSLAWFARDRAACSSASPPSARCRQRGVADTASGRPVVSAAQRNFGRRLRNQRERAQLALSEIAAATKIKRSLFEDLECGDVSARPGGIFRRSFVRAYASAIGLPPESVVEEFTQVFPDGASRASAETKHELRLTLVVDPWRRTLTVMTKVVVALVEAGAVVALAFFAAWMGREIWSACAVIALTYYAAGAACLGRSPGSWYLQHGLPAPSPDVRLSARRQPALVF